MIAPQWYFWDANWWADWPTSANKLMWFYEKSNGPTVDGVVSFTPTVMEELLKIIGPIEKIIIVVAQIIRDEKQREMLRKEIQDKIILLEKILEDDKIIF